MKISACLQLVAAVAVAGLLLGAPARAQSDLVITGVIDGPLSGGTPKAVELYVVNNVADLSIYGVGSANNGGGSDGEEFTFPAVSATAGDFLYIATESVEFQNFFGFAPDYTDSAANINGDDAIELFQNGTVVDTFGDINVDGSGEPWEYLDGWAYRNDETGPDGSTFVLANWSFSGPNALDGETSNATAATPFPTGTYQPPPPAPTVFFASPNSQTVTEGTDANFSIDVQIVNAGTNAISVDVALTGGGATAADFDGVASVTVTFPASAADGSVETAQFTLFDDTDDEGTETATFGLQNLSGDASAVVGSPDTYDLTILDNDAVLPLLVINEIQADPNDDTNNDEVLSTNDDEFVEIVNTGTVPVDMSGYTLNIAGLDRHTFPEGTVLASDQAIVLWGGGDPQGNFAGALAQVTTNLSLLNGGTTVILRNDTGIEVTSVTYGPEGNGNQSLTRDPDLTGPFVQHESATGAGGASFSPGTRVDGTAFGGGDVNAIVTVIQDDGDEGWRMLSAPVEGVTVGDLAAQNLVQGLPDEYPGGNLNIYTDYDGTAFIPPSGETDVLTSGEGFIWYFFDIAYDPADVGILDGDSESFPLPFTLQASGQEPGAGVPGAVVTVPLDNGGKRWELIGNPFTEGVDVTQFVVNGGSLLSNVGQVWDPDGAGSYVLTTDAGNFSGNQLAIWQGAFFQNNDAASITIPTAAKIGSGSPFYGRQGGVAERGRIGFELASLDEDGEQTSFDRAIVLYFGEEATDAWDLLDVTKLTPLRSRYATLAFVGELDGDEVLKAQESRPTAGGSFDVPLAFEASGVSGTFTLTWPRWDNVPEDWAVTLTDAETQTVVDLRADTSYTFAAAAQREAEPADGIVAPKATSLERTTGARFVLSVARAATDAEGESAAPIAFALREAYPNPFATATTVEYRVAHATDVRLTVYDLLGREVATLADGPHDAGTHTATFSGAGLAGGIYFVRMTADGFAATKKAVLLD